VVVDQAHDPGLEVSLREVDEERAFDVYVPELIRLAAFIARSRRSGYGASPAAKTLKELVDVIRTDGIDLTPAHLCRDPLRVPIGVKADGDGDRIDPGWDADPQTVWPAGGIQEPLDAPLFECGQPTI
jgi:hypothetical protein